MDLQDDAIEQGEPDLEDDPAVCGALRGTLDKLNDGFGRGTVLLASAGWWKKRDVGNAPEHADAKVHHSVGGFAGGPGLERENLRCLEAGLTFEQWRRTFFGPGVVRRIKPCTSRPFGLPSLTPSCVALRRMGVRREAVS